MRRATLTRHDTGPEGTFGTLVTDSGFSCRTGELAWHDNEPDRSCIPAGTYACTWRHSPKHGDCYHVENVPGRTNIEIHAANFVGDKDEDMLCELLGCIAPGLQVGVLKGQMAVKQSSLGLRMLVEDLGKEPFELTIVGL